MHKGWWQTTWALFWYQNLQKFEKKIVKDRIDKGKQQQQQQQTNKKKRMEEWSRGHSDFFEGKDVQLEMSTTIR